MFHNVRRLQPSRPGPGSRILVGVPSRPVPRGGGGHIVLTPAVTLLLVLKSLYLSFHPSQWPAHLLVQHSRLERTSKHANFVNRSIIFQPNFEPVYPLTARAEPFDFYIFCRAIHGLSVHIHIARVRVVKKNVLKYAATYRESRSATRSRKTATKLEGILKPGYKVDL